MEQKYLIWSEEHGAWWAPHGLSYTRSIEEAGRFSKERADEIVKDANIAIHRGGQINPERSFNEIPIPDPFQKAKVPPAEVVNEDEEERRRDEYADESDKDYV